MAKSETIASDGLQPLTHEYYWNNWRDFRSGPFEDSKKMFVAVGSREGVALSFGGFIGPHMMNTQSGIRFPLMMHEIGIKTAELVRFEPPVQTVARPVQRDHLLEVLGYRTRPIANVLSIVSIQLVPLLGEHDAVVWDAAAQPLGVALVRDACEREDDIAPAVFSTPLPVYHASIDA